MDGGRRDTGVDTGEEEEDLPTTRCGTKTCTGAIVQQTPINPCCVPDTDACGLNADDLRRANSSTPFTGCIEKDVAAAVEKSDYCGAFWDQVEMVKRANGGLDIPSGSVTLTFDGCCLPSGECGAMITTPRGSDPDAVNTHLGCVSFTRLQEALSSDDAATMTQPENPPFCNTATGEVVMGTATVPGVPKFVCGCGEGNLYDPADATRTFPCINNLQITVCGREDPEANELAQVPEFLCGCVGAQPNGLPCMANVDKAVCGQKQIDADSAELARVPVFICGGGDNPPASPLPLLKGVAPTVCGTKAVPADSSDLNMVPKFICGEMSNPDTSGLPQLRNLPATTCGKLEVTSGSPYLASVPEILCGCPANPTFPCLRNVATDVCGAKQITTGAAELAAVPEFTCGCGADTVDPHTSLPCLSHVEIEVCGAKEIDSTSAELAQVPQFMCGKENNPDTSALPKLSNVDVSVCGTKTIAAGAPELAAIPALVCGCGGAAPTNEFGCLRNMAANVCGTNLSQIPAIACGCGATTALGATESLCIPYTAATTCGTLAITVNTADNCLNNLPEYAVGCGSASPTASNPCVPGAPALHGCNAVSSGTIRGVPTILCGCGDGRLANGAPCIDNVPTSVCGARPIPLNMISYLPMSVCGCGSSTTYDPANPGTFPRPCLSKTATTSCGPGAIHVSDPNNTPGNPADDCYTGWPAYLNGCGSGVTTGNCIYNGSASIFGCNQPNAGRSVPGAAFFACGCGRGQFPSTSPPNCIPNVNTDVCGAVPPTPTDTARAPTFFCGCGATVAAQPSGAPSSRPCLSYTDLTTCGTGSVGVDGAFLASLPSTLCGCGSTGTTWDPSNTTTFPGPCLSKTTGDTCGGTAYCDISDPAGTAPCTGAQTCEDLRGGTGAGPFGFGGVGDGLGDTCQ